MECTVSAPGKIILMGEHAAVYAQPALVAAVNRRVEARLATTGGDGLHLLLPQLEVDEVWSWLDLRDYAAQRRQAWLSWSEERHRRSFREVLDPRPSHLIATALGEVLEHAGELPGFSARLEVRSRLPIGAGFGSSAAAAAAVIHATLLALGLKASAPLVERLVLEVERRQHGTPSGIDGAAIVRGGVLWVERRHGRLDVEPVHVVHSAFYDHLRVAHSGAAAESTGEVVSAVRRLRESSPEVFDARLEEATRATRGLRKDLEEAASEASILERFRTFSSWLTALGVVPDGIRKVIDGVEEAGGAAKISGAGSLRGPGAGSFLLYHPEPGATQRLLERFGALEAMDLRLGVAGVRLERST